MIKRSSDNYSKSSPEGLAIGFCRYIPITFHNNLTKAKIVNELIRQFCHLISYPASQFTQLSPVSILVCVFGHTLGATDFSCAVSGFSQSMLLSSMLKVSGKEL